MALAVDRLDDRMLDGAVDRLVALAVDRLDDRMLDEAVDRLVGGANERLVSLAVGRLVAEQLTGW